MNSSVAFISAELKNQFESLKNGRFENKLLHKWITRAIKNLEDHPLSGIKISKKLWPSEYVKKYQITNLWKYDLPHAWRLLYTIETDEIMIMNIILEWFSHKEYELFKFLFTHPSHVFTREELFVTIWGNSDLGESRTVDVHIRRIRAKIGDNDQKYIKTVRGVGYTLRFENN